MKKFEDFKIKKQLKNAISDLGFVHPTPIQQESYSTILSGKDFVGISQTGTGKTLAYILPLLQNLNYSDQSNPKILILIPTRELVIQIVEELEKLTTYLSVRVVGVYGGSNNINSQKKEIIKGLDIIVGTPRRLFDLTLTGILKLKSINKLIIDEVDIMLDFGYKTQLKNIFEYLPVKRQNILFSATMTKYVDELINNFLISPNRINISVTGIPFENIKQSSYAVPNFYTKVNLLNYLLEDKLRFNKVLIFVSTIINAERLSKLLNFQSEISIIHSKKEQNYRSKSINDFESGRSRILIASDVISRGIDINKISTVISFDTPFYPENYIHRIGRTGRASEIGNSILFYNKKEVVLKNAIEKLIEYKIPLIKFPHNVEKSLLLTTEEKEKKEIQVELSQVKPANDVGASYHEKSAKNSRKKVAKKSYKKQIKERYKKPIRRGDKIQNKKKKNKKK